MLKTRDAGDRDRRASSTFIAGNDHFFLNLSMAACKAMLDAAHGVPGSSMVTAMARNGVEFGIRVSGTGDQWFTAPAPVGRRPLLPRLHAADAAPDLGDSAITETAGLGGFAMAASPAIVKFVGGTPQDAIDNTLAHDPYHARPKWRVHAAGDEFAGSPAGIDVRKVVDTGIQPIINTGIAHREAGVGQIGAGITRAPAGLFHAGGVCAGKRRANGTSVNGRAVADAARRTNLQSSRSAGNALIRDKASRVDPRPDGKRRLPRTISPT